MEEEIRGTLENIVERTDLRWIFVGGKGGVGKTTTSSSLATAIAQKGRKVLIISTDPAHNLSDCFDQKVNKDPTPIAGIENLYAMEIDPKVDIKIETNLFQADESTKSFISEIISSVPGIDEAMSFAQLMNSIEKMDFELIVFDTAPTGHTLRFLNFPSILERGLDKLLSLKQKLGGLIGKMGSIMGSKEQMDEVYEKVFGKMQKMKEISKKIDDQMKDSKRTTFIAVCIPQFLSMYQTQRLIQQLTKFHIDIHNIVINQILFPCAECKMCKARSKMQKKYLDQIVQLYEDFHLILMPLQEDQVRGSQDLKKFSQLLLQHKELPQ